ncbi:hypothetical protein EJ07DRAFT_131247 [Lizonia empirigonia]|nr:hypothetical protein EJ07DRAFT_131247 [Lizonia empirigonia]
MTHAPPNDKLLADLNKWIDRHIQTGYLQHRHRIGDLLNTEMIARSVVEHLFLCRVLSIYAQTKVLAGFTGARLESVLDTDSLSLSYGTIGRTVFVGITASSGRHIILRGECADTYAEAMVSFIDTVLDTSARYQSELLKQKRETSPPEWQSY